MHLTIVEDLACFLIQEQSELLAWVTDRVGIWYLCKDLGEDIRGTFTVASALLLGSEVHLNCFLEVCVRDDITLHHNEVIFQLHLAL